MDGQMHLYDADPLPTRPLPIWNEAFAGLDWLALRFSPVFAGRGIPRGDGAPVVLVPGLLADDAYLGELRSWLQRNGYRAYQSHIGINGRCPDVMIERLMKAVERAYTETGRRVRIIGHSLGGALARGAAMQHPEMIAQVITLGSPVDGCSTHPAVEAAARYVASGCTVACMEKLQLALPESVREVNVFSKSDGIVDWRTSVRRGTQGIEVKGTHIGLVFNAQVYSAISRQLVAESVQERIDAGVAEIARPTQREQPAPQRLRTAA